MSYNTLKVEVVQLWDKNRNFLADGFKGVSVMDVEVKMWMLEGIVVLFCADVRRGQ